MSNSFPFITPTTTLPESGVRVATTLGDFDLGSSTMEEIQKLAHEMDLAGHSLVLVEYKSRHCCGLYNSSSTYELYIVS